MPDTPITHEGASAQQVPDDHPVMIAWKTYSASESFADTRQWALDPSHISGSLWASFWAGFKAASSVPRDRQTDALAKLAEIPPVGSSYTPQLIHYPEDDRLEFIAADVATVARHLGDGCTVLLDMASREPVGFYIEGAKSRLPSLLSAALATGGARHG